MSDVDAVRLSKGVLCRCPAIGVDRLRHVVRVHVAGLVREVCVGGLQVLVVCRLRQADPVVTPCESPLPHGRGSKNSRTWSDSPTLIDEDVRKEKMQRGQTVYGTFFQDSDHQHGHPERARPPGPGRDDPVDHFVPRVVGTVLHATPKTLTFHLPEQQQSQFQLPQQAVDRLSIAEADRAADRSDDLLREVDAESLQQGGVQVGNLDGVVGFFA